MQGETRPGRDVDHSPPTAEVKNEWSYNSTPAMHLHGVDREISPFTFSGTLSHNGVVAAFATEEDGGKS